MSGRVLEMVRLGTPMVAARSNASPKGLDSGHWAVTSYYDGRLRVDKVRESSSATPPQGLRNSSANIHGYLLALPHSTSLAVHHPTTGIKNSLRARFASEHLYIAIPFSAASPCNHSGFYSCLAQVIRNRAPHSRDTIQPTLSSPLPLLLDTKDVGNLILDIATVRIGSMARHAADHVDNMDYGRFTTLLLYE